MKNLLALVLFALCCFSADRADDIPKLTTLQQQIARLETGVQNAEAIRAIKKLQYAYGHYAEFGLWNDFADLFAESGVGHYPSGKLGKEEIRKLFLRDIGKGKLGLPEGQFYPHIMLQPVVTLDPGGKTAKGRWRVLAMLGSYGGTALWAGGIYENEYALENGVWKINDLHYYSGFTGRYEDAGWTAGTEAIPIHYNPTRVGTPVQESTAVPAGPSAPPGLNSLTRHLSALTQRAQRLIDESEVANLQHIYGYYVDRKMWDDVADLFAGNGTMELDQRGVYSGRASIRRALDQFGPQGLREGELNDHLQFQTIIHIAPNGRTARARGVELVMFGTAGVGGQWGENIFENEFVKRNGVWQIKSMHVYSRLLTDYDKGWAKDAKPAPGPSKEFPPDWPPTEIYSTYPKFYIPPFHFSHPVTGRSPQYPEGTIGARPKSDKPAQNPGRSARTVEEIRKNLAEAERLLRTAVAYDAAENLASAYGYYLDEFMWDETADLFTIDAVREFAAISKETGRENIRESFKRRYPGKKASNYFTAHQLVQPVIHVAADGQSARMRVRLFQLGGSSGGPGLWIAGIYECKTAIEDRVWKFKTMDLDYVWTSEYKGGWARVTRESKGFVAAPFPKIVDLPFHYKNPLSGRKPPLLVP